MNCHELDMKNKIEIVIDIFFKKLKINKNKRTEEIIIYKIADGTFRDAITLTEFYSQRMPKRVIDRYENNKKLMNKKIELLINGFNGKKESLRSYLFFINLLMIKRYENNKRS